MKSSWVGAVIFVFIIWTLWSLELNSVKTIVVCILIWRACLGQWILTFPKDKATGTTFADVYLINANDADRSDSDTVVTSATNGGAKTAEGSAPDDVVTSNEEATSIATTMEGSIEESSVSERPLILYAYSETKSARINLKFFIAHGLHAAADFIFIFNGPTDAASLIPNATNIRSVQRLNDCYDIGAYAEVLTTNDLYKSYKKFIMLNASIRGPFLPYWAESCWSDMYLQRVTDEVKLVGMTANCWITFHVQSMIWATDIIGLETLLFPPESAIKEIRSHPSFDPVEHEVTPNPTAFHTINTCFHTWGEAVAAEIGSSALIRAAGYKLDVMMSAYHGKENYEEMCDSKEKGDVLFEGKYFGINVQPFETIFMKSNRNVDPGVLERHSEWMKGRGYSSYDYCRA